MAKQGAKGAMPRLRFPEFRNAPEWENAILGDLSEVVRGGSPRPIDGFLTNTADGLNWLKIGDVDKEAKYVTHTAEKVRPEALSKTRVVNPGDLILSNSMSFGRPYILQIKTCIHDGWIAITGIAQRAGRDFLYYSISAPSSQNYFVDNAAGSGVQNLNADIIKALPVYFPSRPEQQKIADCLTSLDEVIAAQARKVEALKTHKRGLMQQLFPREGETRPRLRFPEFRDAPEWITRSLGELMVIGSSRRVHESDWVTTGVPFYRARELVAIGKGEPINPLFISEALYAEFSRLTGEIDEGQLLVTGVGSIGIPYLVKSGDRFYFKDGNIIWLKNGQVDLSGDFLFRLFESEYVQGQIATMAGIGTVGTYTIENAKRTIASFPVDKREQQRIADCLSFLDVQITAESRQFAAFKTHKQGLMQQLFPSPEDVAA
ncbi:MAG: restriction endonuclease subunit S [Rudaea sp.]|uniref:restriction endonuclease subunit S n=1 Tax=Rudaea sp. TaxID=2136325 RepID=UPI0039E2A14D